MWMCKYSDLEKTFSVFPLTHWDLRQSSLPVLFCFIMRLHVHMPICLYTCASLCLYMCTYICGSRRLTVHVFLGHYLIFSGSASHWTWNSLIGLDCLRVILTLHPQCWCYRCVPPHPPFTLVLMIWTQAYVAITLSTGPLSHPPFRVFGNKEARGWCNQWQCSFILPAVSPEGQVALCD